MSTSKDQQSRKGSGRPAKCRMREKIPDTIENVLEPFLSRPSDKDWCYLEGTKRGKSAKGSSRQSLG